MPEPEPKVSWECLRCLWIITGREGDEIPEHAGQCPFRHSGEDPAPEDLHVGDATAPLLEGPRTASR